jgi:uncharacterized membrane protein
MATKVPGHAVIASFRFEEGASRALAKLKDRCAADDLAFQNAAVLKVSTDGKLHIKETADMSGSKGMAVGGVVGAVIGLFGSAVIWPIGVGAAIGGLASKLRDSGFPNHRLTEVGNRLKPGDSLLIVAVEDTQVNSVSALLKDAGASLVQEAIDGKVVEELETAAAAAPTSPTADSPSMPIDEPLAEMPVDAAGGEGTGADLPG